MNISRNWLPNENNWVARANCQWSGFTRPRSTCVRHRPGAVWRHWRFLHLCVFFTWFPVDDSTFANWIFPFFGVSRSPKNAWQPFWNFGCMESSWKSGNIWLWFENGWKVDVCWPHCLIQIVWPVVFTLMSKLVGSSTRGDCPTFFVNYSRGQSITRPLLQNLEHQKSATRCRHLMESTWWQNEIHLSVQSCIVQSAWLALEIERNSRVWSTVLVTSFHKKVN